jgi:hypothetical protein
MPKPLVEGSTLPDADAGMSNATGGSAMSPTGTGTDEDAGSGGSSASVEGGGVAQAQCQSGFSPPTLAAPLCSSVFPNGVYSDETARSCAQDRDCTIVFQEDCCGGGSHFGISLLAATTTQCQLDSCPSACCPTTPTKTDIVENLTDDGRASPNAEGIRVACDNGQCTSHGLCGEVLCEGTNEVCVIHGLKVGTQGLETWCTTVPASCGGKLDTACAYGLCGWGSVSEFLDPHNARCEELL